MTKPSKPSKNEVAALVGDKLIHRRNLTPTEKKFVELYEGGADLADTMREAGFKGSDESLTDQANRMLRLGVVRSAIRAKTMNPLVAHEEEIKETLTAILRDDMASYRDKMRAAELLGKTYGIYVDKVQHEGSSLQDLIVQSNVEVNTKE